MKQKMPSAPLALTREQARGFSLKKQLLLGTPVAQGKRSALQALGQLGYIQIDTIHVVERSHHLVLFTRCPSYQKSDLDTLHAEKKLFEYWAHEASFIPMSDFRYYLPVMKRLTKKYAFIRNWIRNNRPLMKRVKQRIMHEGPLSARDFKDVRNRKRGTWWDWKPAKTALEMLFWQGDLMIKERKNFQRIYDLTERVLPKNIDTTFPDAKEEDTFFIRRALAALGVATLQDINRYFTVSRRLDKRVQRMVKTGEITKLHISGLKRPYYCLTEDIKKLRRNTNATDYTVRFLSPFDNAIILRERTSALFGFTYALECYTPKDKRKYGYFCLPILWQNKLVGRIDPKADREQNILFISNLHFEKDISLTRRFMLALSRALWTFAEFNQCKHIHISKNIPTKIRRQLSI